MADKLFHGMNAFDVSQFMIKHNLAAEYSPLGFWAVGPENQDGVMNVLGMGSNFLDAFIKAKRSLE